MARGKVSWSAEIPRSITGLRRKVDHLFERFFGDDSSCTTSGYSPATNVAETPSNYEVTMELPGMKPEDFQVELHNNQLVVQGEKREEEQLEEQTFHLSERYQGEFRRVNTLECAVDEDHVDAHYSDGVLRLTIPKSEQAKTKKITVHADEVPQPR